ncbi:hypothetical protein niasHT_006859 [Heterodera trifolii]|uniref:polynucleotide adenylyltransferase n=1 Tax=Heterodera trifolii TaxID=157864 RepID=A0ABD2LNE4_9BILA
MEKALSQMGEAKQKSAESELAEFYLLDLELSHFNAIRFLLGLNGNGEKWKFSEFFDVHQLPTESNFACQLRILHINNAKEKLTQIKKEMRQLLDGKHWAILEFEALAYLAPELLDEQTLAMKYLPIISMGHNEIFTVVEAGQYLALSPCSDDLSFSIIGQYQRVLMLETPLSGAELGTFNTNVLYYVFRQMLIEKVDARQLVKLGAQNAQLGRKVAELMHTNADGRLEGEAEKRKQICQLERFMKWFMKNNEKQGESGAKLSSDINAMLGSDDALKNGPKIESVDDIWQASNCEDEKVANEAVQRLSKCPIIEQIHIQQLAVFYYQHEFFSNFLHANAYNFPIIKNSGLNLSENASDFYYEMIFLPYNDDNQMYAEIMLALRYAMIRIYGLKDQIKGSHSEDLERETIRILIVLRIIELFDDRMPNVRMLCVAMSFLKMLIDKRKVKRLSWDPSAVVAQCLVTEAEQIFAEQRFYMVPYHQEYFKQFLALCKRDDILTTIIREGLCKLSLLSQLIGDDSLFRLFNLTLIREKLIDRNFFNNKKFLLSQNYLGLLIGRTDEQRQTNRVLADLIVLMTNYFDVDKFGHSEAIRKIVDFQWLHCRFLYESVVENAEESRKISFYVGIFIPELIKFLEANKMLANNSKKFTRALEATEREAVAEMETRWFNSKNEYAKPSEMVQKMHFDQLMMLRNDENFTEIYKEIQNNKIAQSNLLQILTKEDMKKFMDEIGGKYEKNESEKEKENGEKIKSEKKKSKKKGKKKNKKGKAETKAKETTQQKEVKFEEKKEAENAVEEKENGKKNEENANENDENANENDENANENDENGKKNEQNANANDENGNENENKAKEFLSGEFVPLKNDHGKVLLAPTESFKNKLSDNELFEISAIKEDEQQKYLLTIFPLHSQQITIVNREYLVNKFNENFDNYLTNLLYQNIYHKKEFERKREAALGQINAIVDNWSNKHARLLISGSLLLDVHTIGSDVNLFCVAPGERLKLSDFMGSDKNGKCVENKCKSEEADDAKSLFCQICEDKSTANLIKIESASILLIRFAFDGIEFDISFVAVPKLEILTQKMDDNELKSLLEHFYWSVNEQKHMLRSLSSFRSTLYISNLFYKEAQQNVKELNESRKTFKNLLILLKIWAKNNYIYSNKIGFLNGIALAIMVAKIVLVYPNSTLPFLLDKFFLFYFARHPQIPIQLTKSIDTSPNANLFLLDARELEMPVLTPTSLVQNAARLVTHSNAKVIRRQMFDALNKISSMKNKQFELDGLLKNSIPFSQKFHNFIVINCVAEDKEEADAFCDFVEWRMRLQIIFDIDKKEGGGIETHLYPNVYQENCILTQKLLQFSFRANHCKIWLLGIYGKNAISERITAMAQNFDMTIKRHYFLKKVQNANIRNIDDFFNTTKIELKSIMAKKEELF